MATEKQPTARVVDIHTHMYPPEYIKILESRDTIPLVRTFPGSPEPRLVLLSAEEPLLSAALKDPSPSILPGRPLTKHYASLDQKIHFMDTHGIQTSILSLANPWLDFLPPSTAPSHAHTTNTSFSTMCSLHPGRLYFFASLPLSAPIPAILTSITQASTLPYCRGIILGTTGLGRGLDDPALLPIFSLLATSKLPIFLHPHYGLPNSVYGPRAEAGEYGHVLPLALGFPMETTIAVTRMYLAGVFDNVPDLILVLAHSGGTLPFLAGRIESCVEHDGYLQSKGEAKKRRTVWEVLRSQIYLDAVVYSEVGLKAAVEAAGGSERLMFGTDHPFFPPVGEGKDEDGEWESVRWNVKAVEKGLGLGEEGRGVMGENAVRVFGLDRVDG